LFKDRKVKTVELAQELEVRYFIEGQVRKFGDQIKISVTLLDVDTGDHLWQDSLKGTMEDVFDIQEQVASKVVAGLEIHLATGEKEQLESRNTESVDAYELCLKAREYYARADLMGYESAAKLSADALKFDPAYPDAMTVRAHALIALYKEDVHDQSLLLEAEHLSKLALTTKSDHWKAYHSLSLAYEQKGDFAAAEKAAKEYLDHLPEDHGSHHALALLYMRAGRVVEAISYFEKALELMPDQLIGYFNFAVALHSIPDAGRAKNIAERALPHYERFLRLHPDQDSKLLEYAALLSISGRNDRAVTMLDRIRRKGLTLDYMLNIAILYNECGRKEDGMTVLQEASAMGFDRLNLLRTHPAFDPFRELPEFRDLLNLLEERQQENA
jgi:adenylate cyclase